MFPGKKTQSVFFTAAGFFLHLVLCAQSSSLPDFLQKGVANSPLLKDFVNQQKVNALDSARLHAQYATQVNFTSNNFYAPNIHGWGYDPAITNGANVSALAGVSKQFIGANNVGNKYQALNLQNQSLNVQGKISEQDLKKNITTQYILAYGDLQQLTLSKEILAHLADQEKILDALAKKGVYRQVDYVSFLLTYQQQQLAVEQYELQYRYDLGQLNYLCGITDTSLVTLADPSLALAPPPDVKNSVFFKQYVIDSLLLINQNALVDYSYKPKFGVYGDAGYLSSLAFTPYKNFGVSAGFYFTFPIYDGHQRQLLHQQNSILQITNLTYKNYFMTQYNQQVALLFQQLNGTTRLADLYKSQMELAKELIDADQALISTGDLHVTDYIVAINNYLSIKNNYVQYEVNRYNIINAINYWNLAN